jgi:hypothetical protein
MAVVFGGETWLLAVFGRFAVSEAAGSGIMISETPGERRQPQWHCGEKLSQESGVVRRW